MCLEHRPFVVWLSPATTFSSENSKANYSSFYYSARTANFSTLFTVYFCTPHAPTPDTSGRRLRDFYHSPRLLPSHWMDAQRSVRTVCSVGWLTHTHCVYNTRTWRVYSFSMRVLKIRPSSHVGIWRPKHTRRWKNWFGEWIWHSVWYWESEYFRHDKNSDRNSTFCRCTQNAKYSIDNFILCRKIPIGKRMFRLVKIWPRKRAIINSNPVSKNVNNILIRVQLKLHSFFTNYHHNT